MAAPPHMAAGRGEVVPGRRGASSRKGDEWAGAALVAFSFFAP